MSKNPLQVIEDNNKALFENIKATRTLAFEEGAISRKNKILIALALDASLGSVNGVRSLALLAMEVGASKEEIMEAINVAHFISGVGSVYTAAQGFEGIL